MNETKIFILNKDYYVKASFDLVTLDIDFWSISRVTNETLEHHGQDLFGLVQSFGNFKNHLDILGETIYQMKVIFNWISDMDVDELISENYRIEAEERRAND